MCVTSRKQLASEKLKRDIASENISKTHVTNNRAMHDCAVFYES